MPQENCVDDAETDPHHLQSRVLEPVSVQRVGSCNVSDRDNVRNRHRPNMTYTLSLRKWRARRISWRSRALHSPDTDHLSEPLCLWVLELICVRGGVLPLPIGNFVLVMGHYQHKIQDHCWSQQLCKICVNWRRVRIIITTITTTTIIPNVCR